MSHRPLYGHQALRRRLARAIHEARLPASLLLSGPVGVGKQRLALWVAQLLLCQRASEEGLSSPCDSCQQCRYALRGVHPDLHWYFPRPSLGSDAKPETVLADLNEAITERMAADGLWTAASGTHGIFMDTTRVILARSSTRPAMARRRVIVVADADRMTSQEGADQAANAFLKLLEEPPPSTTIILTSSEPGNLLPTIKSRVVTARVAPLSADDMADFVADIAVQRRLARTPDRALVRRGAPGELLAGGTDSATTAAAQRLLDAALGTSHSGVAERANIATRQGVSGARGVFSETLEALTKLLHSRTATLVREGRDAEARRAAFAIMAVEEARSRAQNNVNPQLLAAGLLASLHRTLRP